MLLQKLGRIIQKLRIINNQPIENNQYFNNNQHSDSEYRVTPARQVSNEAPAMALCSFFRQAVSAHAAFD